MLKPNRGVQVTTTVSRRGRRRPRACCCFFWFLILLVLLLAAIVWLGFFSPWSGRVNLLLLGLDRRPGEGDIVRADTIMVLTALPGEPAVGLLSIPRDLYLSIPAQGENRINTAHVFGEMERPGGGPERTAAAVTQNFGIPLDGWVRVDFNAFVELVDAVGGVEIDVPQAVVDTAYPTEDYGTMTIEIPAGLQTMNGERALQYARSRHNSSDFDRAERQQQILQALFTSFEQPSTWLRLPAILTAFRDSIETDLTLWQLARLGVAALRVGADGVERLVIDREMVVPFTTPAGAAVLSPRWDLIRPRVGEMFDLE